VSARFALGLLAIVGAATIAVPVHAAGPRRTTVFLDFGGGLVGPGDDSSLGQATCVPKEFLYPIFLGSERASEVALAEARRVVAPFGIRVVGERPPAHLPYTHVRIGGDPSTLGLDPKLNGLSCDVDCDDVSHRDTVFMFAEKWVASAALAEVDEDQRAAQVGLIAMHEAGHAWGLEHAGASGSVMARFPSTGAPEFLEGCEALDIDHDASECPVARERHCPEGEQDAHAELLALFGDGSPDVVVPQAVIVWPPDGHVMQPGETLAVEVEVDDDHEGFGWRLEVPELGWEHLGRDGEGTTLELVVPEGRFTLRLEAIDHDRNVGEAEVVIEASWPAAEEEAPPPGPEAACACRSEGQGRGSAWWAVFGVLVSIGRRRRRMHRVQ
jgi:MYXO-CTERM domain-containing protein